MNELAWKKDSNVELSSEILNDSLPYNGSIVVVVGLALAASASVVNAELTLLGVMSGEIHCRH